MTRAVSGAMISTYFYWGSDEKEKIRFSELQDAILGKHVITFSYFNSDVYEGYTPAGSLCGYYRYPGNRQNIDIPVNRPRRYMEKTG